MKSKKLYLNKKYSEHCSVILKEYTKEDKLLYQFLVMDRYRGKILWKSKLQLDKMECVFEGVQMVHHIEEGGHPDLKPLSRAQRLKIEADELRALHYNSKKNYSP